MVEVGKIGGETLVLDGRYISIFRAGKLAWKRAYRGYILPDGNLYSYRRRVRITELSGKTLTDYQVKIEIGAGDPIWKHARSAGEDIRFCYYPEEVMLSYWIEKFDPVAEEAIIWVKVPSIPASSETEIYMYYGNPTVASASDVIATFIRVIDGLVGSWHLDEGSGNIAHDSSGQGNDGTIYGATWTDGKFGKALNFDGVDDYVEIIHDGSLYVWQGNSPVTFEVWVKPLFDIPPSAMKVALQFKDGAGTGRTILYVEKDGNFYSYFGGSALNSGVSAVKGQFTHVILRYDGSVLKFFIDGAGAGEASKNIDEGAVGAFLLGTHKLLAYWWQGVIDEVRIYDKALSAEEISDLYNNYGYTTTNYPGKVLVRKYTEPEPSVSVGAEE